MKRFLFGFGRNDDPNDSTDPTIDPSAPTAPLAPSDPADPVKQPSSGPMDPSSSSTPSRHTSTRSMQDRFDNLKVDDDTAPSDSSGEGGKGKGGRMRKKVLGGGKSAFGKIRAGFLGGGGGGRSGKEGSGDNVDAGGEVPSAPAATDPGEEDLYAMKIREAEKRQQYLYGGDDDDGDGGDRDPSRKNSSIPGGDAQHPAPPGLPTTPPSAPPPPPDGTFPPLHNIPGSAHQYPGGAGYPTEKAVGDGHVQRAGPGSQAPTQQGPGADYFASIAYGRPARQASIHTRGFGGGGDGNGPGGYDAGGGGDNNGFNRGLGAQPVGWGNVFGDVNPTPMGPGFTVKPMYRPPPPIHDVSPEIAEKIKRAKQHTAEALSQDEKANYGQAQDSYMSALSILIPAVKQLEGGKMTMRREQEKQKATKLAQQLLARCESIKPFVEANATVAVLEASSAPKTMPKPPSDDDNGSDGEPTSKRRPRFAGQNIERSTSSDDLDLTNSAEDATVDAPPPPPPPPPSDSFDDDLIQRIGSMATPFDKAKAAAPSATIKTRGVDSSHTHDTHTARQRQPPPLPPRIRSANAIQPDLSATNGKWECGICTTWRADTATKCRHLYCDGCIRKNIRLFNQCPSCEAPCTIDDLVKVNPPDSSAGGR